MDGLADIAVQYFCTNLFSGSDDIDPDFSSTELQSFPESVTALNDAEGTALKFAVVRTSVINQHRGHLNEYFKFNQLAGGDPKYSVGVSKDD